MQGIESTHAEQTPVRAFVPPGPVVTTQTPKFSVARE